ncbi:MAG TPA: ADP-ribosylglycohydrolase family protein [Candidatus Hydrogenedentes bacterium]|nr:ADP-ribosylglycohydrolase family protein [Candidatus Hydrogenedentota bacterium]
MKRRIVYTEYINRVHGCWLGKCIAGAIGASYCGQEPPQEVLFVPAMLENLFPNSDLDLQVLWLEVLEQKGIHFTREDLTAMLEKKCPYTPSSSAMRSEIWACVAPGNPVLAAELAGRGSLAGPVEEFMYAEQFLAVMEAMAFIEPDLEVCLDKALDVVPKDSPLYKMVRDVRAWCNETPDWRKTREYFLRNYQCPKCPSFLKNSGLTLLALHYGESDFMNTMMIALHCGGEGECVCATAGAILGVHHAATGLMNRYTLMDQAFALGVNAERRSDRICDLAEDIARIGTMLSSGNDALAIQGIPKALNRS